MHSDLMIILIAIIAAASVGILIVLTVVTMKITKTLSKIDLLMEEMQKNGDQLTSKIGNLLNMVESKASESISKVAIGSFIVSTAIKLFKKTK